MKEACIEEACTEEDVWRLECVRHVQEIGNINMFYYVEILPCGVRSMCKREISYNVDFRTMNLCRGRGMC